MATWIRWLWLGQRKDISTRCTTRHGTKKRPNCMGGLTATGATSNGTLAESGVRVSRCPGVELPPVYPEGTTPSMVTGPGGPTIVPPARKVRSSGLGLVVACVGQARHDSRIVCPAGLRPP